MAVVMAAATRVAQPPPWTPPPKPPPHPVLPCPLSRTLSRTRHAPHMAPLRPQSARAPPPATVFPRIEQPRRSPQRQWPAPPPPHDRGPSQWPGVRGARPSRGRGARPRARATSSSRCVISPYLPIYLPICLPIYLTISHHISPSPPSLPRQGLAFVGGRVGGCARRGGGRRGGGGGEEGGGGGAVEAVARVAARRLVEVRDPS